MKVVLLFFLTIIALIILATILFIFSSIRLNIKKLNINNIEQGIKKQKLEKDIEIFIELYLFGKIKIASIRANKDLINNVKLRNNINFNIQNLKNKTNLGQIKNIKIKQLNFSAQIGTEELTWTIYAVTLISSLAGILARNANYKDVKFNVMPLYHFGNAINLKLSGVLELKMIHSIRTIYDLVKKEKIKQAKLLTQ